MYSEGRNVMKEWKVVLTVLISAALCGCGNSGATFNGNKVETDDTFEIDFSILNTSYSHDIECESGDSFSVWVDSEGGSIALTIQSGEDDPVYQGNNIPTTSFEVGIQEAGTYTVTVTGKKAKGHVTVEKYEPEVIVEESDDYTHVIDRVLNEFNFTPVEWGTTIDNSQDALISLAEDSTGRYKVYGIISKEKGCYGIILNDTIDGTDSNTNYAYEEWIYTEYEGDKPEFTWKDDKLYLTYPVADEDLIIPKTVHIDCGYDTGHMEIDVNADGN